MKEYIPDYKLEPPEAPKYLSCPICGTDLYDYIIQDENGDTVGCSECTTCLTADEYMEICGGDKDE